MARKAYWVRNTASSNIFRLDGSATTPFGFPLPHNWIDLKVNLQAAIGGNQTLYDITTPADNPNSVWVVGKRKSPAPWTSKGVAYSQDAGNTWYIPVLPSTADFQNFGSGGYTEPDNCNKVCTVKDTASGKIIVYVACDYGFILKCADAYAPNPTFTIVAKINEPVAPGSSSAQNIQSIHFITPLMGVVGLTNAVYYTINGGVNWIKLSNDNYFKTVTTPTVTSPGWAINGIVGVYINVKTAPILSSDQPCGNPGLPTLQVGDIVIQWVGKNGAGVITNTGGIWNNYRCNCPCNYNSPSVTGIGPCNSAPNPGAPGWGQPYNYDLTHLSHVFDNGYSTSGTGQSLWAISGSINQLTWNNNNYGPLAGGLNLAQYPLRFCYNSVGVPPTPSNNTTTRWNSATAFYRLGSAVTPSTGGNGDAEGFILYNDGPNGITVGYQASATGWTEVVSQNWPWTYSGFGTTPASYPVQQPIGTIWVAGEDEPLAAWQLTPCVYNPLTPTVYTTADLAIYDDTVITDFYINNQLTSQCYTVAGPLQNYNGSLTSVVVDPALVTVYPVSTTPAPGACYYCGIGCYKLIECGNPNNVQYVFSTNQATIDLLVGSLYQTVQSPQICDNKCFYLTRCTGLPTNPIMLDTVLQNQSLQLTAYTSCAECLGVAPDLEPKPRAIKPGFYTPGCPPEYTVKTSSMYGEQVYDEMVSIRYGINICCDHDIDKWDIKKQLLELKAIYDDCACETTLNPCPACVEPCNVTADVTSYVIYQAPPAPPPCLLPTQVNIGITTTP